MKGPYVGGDLLVDRVNSGNSVRPELLRREVRRKLGLNPDEPLPERVP